jgi:hypothetical protein
VRSLVRRRRHERSALQRRQPKGADTLEVREEVEAALSLLKPTERQAVVLRYLHAMEHKEIAYVLGVSVNACRLKVHKGVRKLRGTLGGHAAALVAALGLPQVSADAALIQGSVTAAAAAKTIATGGAIIMSTGIKLAGAAVVGAALSAAGVLMVTLGNGGETRHARSSRDAPYDSRQSPATVAGEEPLTALEPTPEEIEWLSKTLQKERVRREKARIRPGDTGLDILERVIEHGADVSDLVRDFDRFQSHVHAAKGRTVRVPPEGDVRAVHFDEIGGGAAVIEFGPGTFELDYKASRFHVQREDIRQLEIRGAGMDDTTIVSGGRDFITALKRIEHLRIHDLTFDGGDRGSLLLDIRGKVAVILENVRFKAWASAGYGAPVGLSGGAYLGSRRCEWLGGHRDREGYAGVAIRGTAIASLKGCVFADVGTVVMGGRGAALKSAVHLEGCLFENSSLADSRILHQDRPEFPISVRGGEVFYESRERWGARFAAEVVGVTFHDRIPRCKLEDLLAAIRAVPLEDGRQVQGAQLLAARRTPPRELVVYIWNSPEYMRQQSEKRKRVNWSVLVAIGASGQVKIEPEDRRRRPSGHNPGHMIEGGRSIDDVVGRAHLDLSMEAYGLVRSTFGPRERIVPAVHVLDARGLPFLILDGVTGEVLYRRDS